MSRTPQATCLQRHQVWTLIYGVFSCRLGFFELQPDAICSVAPDKYRYVEHASLLQIVLVAIHPISFRSGG